MGAQNKLNMRFRIHGTKEWLSAVRLSDINSTDGEIWRYSISNYTDGRQSISIVHGSRDSGTMFKEVFFDKEADIMSCICVCHGGSLEVYSESHLWDIGHIDDMPKVKTIVFCHTDGTATGVSLNEPMSIDIDKLKSKIENNEVD